MEEEEYVPPMNRPGEYIRTEHVIAKPPYKSFLKPGEYEEYSASLPRNQALKEIQGIANKILEGKRVNNQLKKAPVLVNQGTDRERIKYSRDDRIEALKQASNVYNENKYKNMTIAEYLKDKKAQAQASKDRRKAIKNELLGPRIKGYNPTEEQRKNRAIWDAYRAQKEELQLKTAHALRGLVRPPRARRVGFIGPRENTFYYA